MDDGYNSVTIYSFVCNGWINRIYQLRWKWQRQKKSNRNKCRNGPMYVKIAKVEKENCWTNKRNAPRLGEVSIMIQNIRYEYINMIKGSHFGPWYIFASLTNSSRTQTYVGFVVSSLPNKFVFLKYILYFWS